MAVPSPTFLAEFLGLNEEQFKAAADCQYDVLVSAGAGTGKTRVLTARYLFLVLLHDYRPGQIAAITFTNKAALEMRERIREALLGLAGTFSAARTALDELDEAPIGTIHGFCLRLGREEPFAGGLLPGTTVLGEEAAAILLRAAGEEALATALSQVPPPPGLEELLATFGRRRLVELLEEVYRAACTRGLGPAELTVETVGEDPYRCGEDLLRFWDRLLAIPGEDLPAGTKKALAALGRRKEDLVRLLHRGEDDPVLLREIEGLLGGLRANACRMLAEEGKALLARWRQSLAVAKAGRIGPVFIHLLRMVAETYEAEKRRRDAVDFADLELAAKRILADEGVRRRLRIRYPVLLIDEFQDTNPLQWAIVEAFRQGPEGARLFVVGDVKQAIYRFRGAEVRLMKNLRRELAAGGGRVYTLQENYRCLPEVAAFINHVAGRLLAGDPPYEPLIPRRTVAVTGPRIEIFLVDEERLDREAEAAVVAERITRLLAGEEKPVLDGDPRPPRPGEIALLFRAATDIDLYEKALRRVGLPVRSLVGKGLFSSPEVADLLALLAVVDRATHGVALAAALRSPLFGVSDAGLYLVSREGGLVKGFYALADPAGLGDDGPRLLKAREVIRQLQEKRHLLPLDRLLAEAMALTDYRSLQALFPDYRQRLANLDRLLALAGEYARLGRGEIGEFLAYIKAMEALEVGEGGAASGGEEAITLLTVHRAKGLEFPVVFIPDLGRTLSPRSAPVLLAEDGRLGFRFGHKNDGLITPLWDELDTRAAQEEEEEAKRLFYVAMTRARDYLVLVGSGRPKQSNNWLFWLKETLPLPEEEGRVSYPGGEAVFYRGRKTAVEASSLPKPVTLLTRYPAIRQGESLGFVPVPLSNFLATVSFQAQRPVVGVSGWLTFRHCPRRFFLRHRLGIPERFLEQGEEEDKIKGALLGRLVHARAAAIAGGEGGGMTTAGEIGRLLAHYRQSESFLALAGASQVFTEYEFTITFSTGIIHGVADLVWIDGEGRPCLADLKTHRWARPEEEELFPFHCLQVQVYALALARFFGRPVARARLEYLWSGHGVEVACDPVSLDNLAQEIEEFLHLLASSPGLAAFPPSPGEACRWCGYGKGGSPSPEGEGPCLSSP